MTSGNTDVASRIHHVSGNNWSISSKNADVAGCIRSVGCGIVNAGDRIDNVRANRTEITFAA